VSHQNILIVGPHGKTGSRVASRLNATGVGTRGVSRATTPAFDWRDELTWLPAMQGTRSAYLTYHPDLSVPQAGDHIRKFCAMARRAGIEHVVLLSGRGEEGAARAEQELRHGGLDWNVVQASWFAQNFSESFMLDSIIKGELVVPSGTSAEPFIDADDIADVAVAALLEPALRNRHFELTGPRLMTFAECMQEIGNATGHPVRLTEVPMQRYVAALRAQGLAEHFVTLLQTLFADLFDGRNAHTASGVHAALGRAATDFSEYASKAAATGIWNSANAGRA
jgi:uncharacterized protein YbjT (DUF2867 family)